MSACDPQGRDPNVARCPWCGDDALYVAYHDDEWGRPEWDGRALFELLMLEGFQAGLSWITILRKRRAFRAAFDGFDPARIARYDKAKIADLLADPGIIRHRGKIEATVAGARIWLDLQEQGGEEGFSRFIWSTVDGNPIRNRFTEMAEVPAETPASQALSKRLKDRGFKFCGPTITYAFMQAAGLVNDHLQGCHRFAVD